MGRKIVLKCIGELRSRLFKYSELQLSILSSTNLDTTYYGKFLSLFIILVTKISAMNGFLPPTESETDAKICGEGNGVSVFGRAQDLN